SDPDDVIVDDTVSKERSAIKIIASVAGRTRSRAGKNVATAGTPVQTSKSGKVTRSDGKKPLYGPPMTK
ncbi:hypothetical protein A2U01_0075309, partial [Trifolium medium]|nr:hypothetical protein [Trifolium medium]